MLLIVHGDVTRGRALALHATARRRYRGGDGAAVTNPDVRGGGGDDNALGVVARAMATSYVPPLLNEGLKKAEAKRTVVQERRQAVCESTMQAVLEEESTKALAILDEVSVLEIVMTMMKTAARIAVVRNDQDVGGAFDNLSDEALDRFLDQIKVRAAVGHPVYEAARFRRKLTRAMLVELRDNYQGRHWITQEYHSLLSWMQKRARARYKAEGRRVELTDLLESSTSICDTLSRELVDPILQSTLTCRPKPANMFELGAALVSEDSNLPMLTVVDKHASRRKRPLNPGRIKALAERLLSRGGVGLERRDQRLVERVAALGLASFNIIPRLVRAGNQRIEVPKNANELWRNLSLKLESMMMICQRYTPGQCATASALRRAASKKTGFAALTSIAVSHLKRVCTLHRNDWNSTFDFDNSNQGESQKYAAMGRQATVGGAGRTRPIHYENVTARCLLSCRRNFRQQSASLFSPPRATSPAHASTPFYDRTAGGWNKGGLYARPLCLQF